MGISTEQYRAQTAAGDTARELTVDQARAQIERFFGAPAPLPELTDQQLAEGDIAAERR